MLSAVDPPGKRKRYVTSRSKRAIFAAFRSERNSILDAMDFLQAEPDLSDLIHRDSKTGELYVEGSSHYLWDCVYEDNGIGSSEPVFVRNAFPQYNPHVWEPATPVTPPETVWSKREKEEKSEAALLHIGELFLARLKEIKPRVIRCQHYQCDTCGWLMEHSESWPGQWDKGPVYVSPGLFHKPHYPVAGEPQCEGYFHRVGLNTDRPFNP